MPKSKTMVLSFTFTVMRISLIFLMMDFTVVMNLSTSNSPSSEISSAPPVISTTHGQSGSSNQNTESPKSFREKEVMVAVFTLVLLVICGLFVLIVFCIGEFENKHTGLWRSRRLSVAVDHDHKDIEKEFSKYNKF